MSNSNSIFNGLPRRILRRVENDFNDTIKDPNEKPMWLDDLYRRVRRSILDEINDVLRTIKKENESIL